jgi:hypothetical protein
MAIMTQLRGMHNSGVFAVDKKKPEAAAKIVKTIGPSHNLAYEKGFSAWQDFVSKNAGAIVGHGRHGVWQRGATLWLQQLDHLVP